MDPTRDTAEKRDLRERARAFFQENRPSDPGFKLPQTFLEVESEAQFLWLKAWQKQVYGAGLLGVEWPTAYGGKGLPSGSQRVVAEEMGRAGVPFIVNRIGLDWAGPTILAVGTEEQKQRYLRNILSCDEVWCQGFSEPGAGSDLASLRTSAVRQGDHYIVNGHKVWTTQALWADFMILLARTDPSAPKHAGISYFLFPMKSKGVSVRPLVKMTGEGGFNQVLFEDALVPASCLLAGEGDGWRLAVMTLAFERGASEGSATGGALAAGGEVARLVALAKEVSRDGRPASEDPVMRDRIAELAIEEEALLASALRARVPGLVEERPLALPFLGKLVSTEFGQRVAAVGQELEGPLAQYAFGAERAAGGGHFQRAYMNSFGFTIGGGTSEIQRNLVGERILGLPKST
ncbi:acyl-CoA dehydrogenase family protein [Polyangium mundeleinium]|uniref:Acyl-CoA dehydrogenase family protein n=1 Tax=Polyangium mundeleinium TaxID=2995306 RepID=A0ABT5EH03_9BACT|nr:acyl-CoA dehydrogenase family protein [Polyangium mundeleinium]MDC0741107.1 acyl-CoA dehydrogenase family protein [Polyangium mundeleinium]